MTSLYRRHRPQAFSEVVGQEHVVRTLSNAIERDQVHHAYLFVGSRGTGKTSIAKILARSLNCEQGPTLTPCGECESCRTIAASTSLDVIEMDAASNRSVDDIRELRERVGYAPAASRWKVYILDEAHMLTKEAWNAFLKTLEEPPPRTLFVLATTEAHKVMPTIVDRCQRFDFRRPSPDEIAEVIGRVAAVEGIEIDGGATAMIARAASGSFRDALGTLDQLVSYGGATVEGEDVLSVLGVAEAELLFEAADAIAGSDGKAALAIVDRLVGSGRDLPQFATDLISHLRHLLVARTAGEVPRAFALTGDHERRLGEQAERLGERALVRGIDRLSEALAEMREGLDPRAMLEVALLRAARPQSEATLEAVLDRLDRLERDGSSPAAVPAPAPDGGDEARGDGGAQGEGDYEAQGAGEPDAAPAPPLAAGDEPVDLDTVRRLWPAVIERLEESGSMVLSRVFEGARPVAAEGGVLRVGFPASAPFNRKKAEGRDNTDRLAEAIRTVTGTAVQLAYTLLDEEGAEEKLSEDELVERIKEAFDAEEVAADAPDGEPGE